MQKISLQPRICSKLWEALRKYLRESSTTELEFFSHSRQEVVQNFWTESLLMFRQRLKVYIDNQDLLTIKQKNFMEQGRKFIEEESRAQRLIEFYCDMCERAE